MKKLYTFSLWLLLAFWSVNTFADDTPHEPAIKQLVKQFKQSIEQKDAARFLSLFHSDAVSWVGVMSRATVELLVSKDPRFAAQPTVIRSSPKAFIEGIVKEDATTREQSGDLHIVADQDVASVTFDYQLYKNEKLKNWGKENWQLIHTSEGWKINAVNFSFTLNPAWFSAQ